MGASVAGEGGSQKSGLGKARLQILYLKSQALAKLNIFKALPKVRPCQDRTSIT